MRTELISKNFSELIEKQVKFSSREIQGPWGEEIIQKVRRFIKTGEINKNSRFPYRNPETGELPDIVFNPYDLADDLRTAGFKVIELGPLLPIAKEGYY